MIRDRQRLAALGCIRAAIGSQRGEASFAMRRVKPKSARNFTSMRPRRKSERNFIFLSLHRKNERNFTFRPEDAKSEENFMILQMESKSAENFTNNRAPPCGKHLVKRLASLGTGPSGVFRSRPKAPRERRSERRFERCSGQRSGRCSTPRASPRQEESPRCCRQARYCSLECVEPRRDRCLGEVEAQGARLHARRLGAAHGRLEAHPHQARSGRGCPLLDATEGIERCGTGACFQRPKPRRSEEDSQWHILDKSRRQPRMVLMSL